MTCSRCRRTIYRGQNVQVWVSGTVGLYRAASITVISCCEDGYRLYWQSGQRSERAWQPAGDFLFLADAVGDTADGLGGVISCEVVDGHCHAVAVRPTSERQQNGQSGIKQSKAHIKETLLMI